MTSKADQLFKGFKAPERKSAVARQINTSYSVETYRAILRLSADTGVSHSRVVRMIVEDAFADQKEH